MLLWMGQRSGAFAASLLGWSMLVAGCAREPAETAERWRVQHYQMPCMGEGPRLCYLIDRGKGEFEYFYDGIEGFEYRWGFNYEIAVTSSTRPAMADASTLQHRLVDVIERRRAQMDVTFSLPLSLEGQTLIAAKDGVCSLLGAIDIDTREQSCDTLRNRETAVFRHGATEPKLVPVITSP
jgi:hypothetical protein